MELFGKYDITPVTVKDGKNYAKFDLFPLERGFGTTIGNSLRRVLLSSIPGAAVFAIRINSISHEFQAIPGILEDITFIVMNTKRLVVKVDQKIFDTSTFVESGIENWPPLTIRKNKKGAVLAKDIVCPPGVEVINKNLKICELTEDISLEIDFFVAVGKDYKSFIENKEELNTLKIIAIDSNFSPILKVDWSVLETRVSKFVLYDKLSIGVATDGSISPHDAIALAAKILSVHLDAIANIDKDIFDKKIMREEVIAPIKSKKLSSCIEDLCLTSRSHNCLKSNGINTIPELINMTAEEIENLKSLGKKSLKEIMDKLKEKGYHLRKSK